MVSSWDSRSASAWASWIRTARVSRSRSKTAFAQSSLRRMARARVFFPSSRPRLAACWLLWSTIFRFLVVVHGVCVCGCLFLFLHEPGWCVGTTTVRFQHVDNENGFRVSPLGFCSGCAGAGLLVTASTELRVFRPSSQVSRLNLPPHVLIPPASFVGNTSVIASHHSRATYSASGTTVSTSIYML